MASDKQQSSWLELVQRLERAIGEPVESWVRSDAYFDVMTQLKRARAEFTRSFEESAEQWLLALNLPAATDVRRLREQLSRLERTVERMGNDLADREEAAELPPRPAAKPRAASPPKPKPDPPGGP
jgi:uncharacterized membrane protein YccC